MSIPATRANMVEYQWANPVAWSAVTGEQYSADPRDYWYLADSDCLTDDQGLPMELVSSHSIIVPLDDDYETWLAHQYT